MADSEKVHNWRVRAREKATTNQTSPVRCVRRVVVAVALREVNG
jgi:hypothetical protein